MYALSNLAKRHPDNGVLISEITKTIDLNSVIKELLNSTTFVDCEDAAELRGMMHLINEMYTWQMNSLTRAMQALESENNE